MTVCSFSPSGTDHISVCICTFQRPELLSRALEGVILQVTEDQFTFEIVVIDNDRRRTAEDIVIRHRQNLHLKIVYDCEPEQNIALTRNRAILNASGNLVAFMDDDEYPVNNWLLNLYLSMRRFNADGALGPVLPSVPSEAPAWLLESKVLDRRRFQTGTRLTVRDTRTGNVLLSKSIFIDGATWFDPLFGRTGGEDVDFFRRQFVLGHVFVWCDEAVVYETVPNDRWSASFHIKKFARIGTLNGERLRKSGIPGSIGLMRTAGSVPVWLSMYLLLLLFGKHYWIRPLLKFAYSFCCVSAYCGFSIIRERA